MKFDDVLNDQRKTIFDQRLELMNADDISEIAKDMQYDVADDIINQGNQSSIYSSHMADAGSDQQSLEHAYSIINRESSFLNYLDLALQRIDDTSFGVCSKCGELMSKERLMEVPHATKCFDCKTSNV